MASISSCSYSAVRVKVLVHAVVNSEHRFQAMRRGLRLASNVCICVMCASAWIRLITQRHIEPHTITCVHEATSDVYKHTMGAWWLTCKHTMGAWWLIYKHTMGAWLRA